MMGPSEAVAARCMQVFAFESREEMGRRAAAHAAERIQAYCARDGSVNVIFAAAPSQDEFYDSLASMHGIPWERVDVFQLDEYVGLASTAPERFGRYLQGHLFDRVPIANVHLIDDRGQQEPELIRSQYAERLREVELHLACIGIGENGHIAFNDPGSADFADPESVRIAELDDACRAQQVHDGCFRTKEEVPTHAITVTVPLIMSAKEILCVVPGARKALAVERTLEGPITEECPASVLRRHPSTRLLLDGQSSTRIFKGV